MKEQRGAWAPEQRERFWQAVRGRMGELQLDQAQVAHELGLHPSNLSRRLRGGVQDPPTEPMVQMLLRVLQLEGDRADTLRRLAAVQGQAGRAPAAGDSLPPDDRDERPQRPSSKHAVRLVFLSRWLVPSVALLLLLLLAGVGAAALMRLNSAPPAARITQPVDGSSAPLGWVDVAGTARGLSGGGPERLWLVEHLAGYYWPQQQAVMQNENWAAQIRLGAGTSDIDKRLDILLVLAPGDVDREFRGWLDQGAVKDDYPPMRGLPGGASILDRVTVTIRPD